MADAGTLIQAHRPVYTVDSEEYFAHLCTSTLTQGQVSESDHRLMKA